MAFRYLVFFDFQGNESRERIYRNRCDAFSLEDDSFLNLFRLPKRAVRTLCSDLRNELQPISAVRTTLSVETQVLCSLRFFATGSYQKAIGQDLMITLSQPSVSRAIKKVAIAMNKLLLKREIGFPHAIDYPNIKTEFMSISGFPGAIGALDCTHVAIIAPPEPSEDSYLNRKGYHSINVQSVCDTNLKILNINAKYPGKSHDAFIWRFSRLRDILEAGNNNNQNSWLLGDSGYPLEPWLMTPILNPVTDAEQRYNAAHSKARTHIERCNGVLKSRFRCLSKHRVLNYEPTMASRIINSCAILHNICIKNRIDVSGYDGDGTDDDDDDDEEDSNDEDGQIDLGSIGDASSLRSRLINNHFS